MNKLPPNMAQFTAINGKKIPNELYNEGENFSTMISTNCTMVAIVAINMINDKKLKSYAAYSSPNQLSAPSCNIY